MIVMIWLRIPWNYVDMVCINIELMLGRYHVVMGMVQIVSICTFNTRLNQLLLSQNWFSV